MWKNKIESAEENRSRGFLHDVRPKLILVIKLIRYCIIPFIPLYTNDLPLLNVPVRSCVSIVYTAFQYTIQ